MKKKQGFSLIELLISLIIVSIIIATFTPVLTTKLKHREIALTGSKVGTECSKKFSEKCMVCTDSECILCNNSFSCPYGQYCDEAQNCICKSCSSKFSNCIKCTKNYCEICKDGYKVNSKGFCEKIKCVDGTYPSGSNCLPCLEPCATCKSATECTGCIDGYTWNGKECVKESGKTNAACYEIALSKICIAKFNAGDPGGLPIPEGLVTIISTEVTSSNKYEESCWRGTTTDSKNCDSANGGYNGCTRTLCTYAAAEKICKHHGWRLPTRNEMSSFATYSTGKGSSGLQLCDNTSGYSSAQCSLGVNKCRGSYNNYCYPYHVWSGDTYSNSAQRYAFKLTKGSWTSYIYSTHSAYSVRCVRDL